MTRKSPKITQLFLLVLFSIVSLVSCKNNQESKETIETSDSQIENQELFFEISLAQWSLSKPIIEGEMDPMDFAQKAQEMGFSGIEYVSGLYNAEVEKTGLATVLNTLKARSERYNVENVLIMIDGEGDLAISDEAERNNAVENHKKWVDAAKFLGAHSIRVNLFGSDDAEEWKANSIDGLKKLGEYGSSKGINVLVENHGYLSSNAKLLVEVIEGVNLPNVGTLPDFGNFCLKREGGERWQAACIEEYPKYQGVEEMMPHAKAVSAKSYAFDESGQETTIDYGRMLKIVKDAGYTGFIGIEYEGTELSPEEGIKATKELLIAEGSKL
ncbi:MAG: sugar phosphate isomerase/epimerase family protein [Bacteroidota bacterium]